MSGGGRTLDVVVITASERAHAGVYPDRAGDLAQKMVEAYFAPLGTAVAVRRELLPDDRDRLRAALARAVAEGADLVLTTGGTGLGPRDVTPEATRDVLEREAPGLVEAVRARYRQTVPQVDLSRATAGAAGRTVICNLPGSPKAAGEFLAVLLPLLPHAMEMAAGGETHPA